MNLKKTLLPLLVSSSLLSGMALSATPAFTPAQEARIGQVATEYLVAHPEILIQVSKNLQLKQHQQQLMAMTKGVLQHTEALTGDKDTPVYGPANAKVTVVEFFDYQCAFCASLAPEMEKIMRANPQVRFVFREWPIFGERWESSEDAARTGLGIWKEQGADAYLKYHNGIFATGHDEGKLTAEDIRQVAASVNALPAKKDAMQPALDKVNALAQQIGFSGTPGMVVLPTTGATVDNTTVIPGMAGEKLIQSAINKAEGHNE